jgi:hypothetical protein
MSKRKHFVLNSAGNDLSKIQNDQERESSPEPYKTREPAKKRKVIESEDEKPVQPADSEADGGARTEDMENETSSLEESKPDDSLTTIKLRRMVRLYLEWFPKLGNIEIGDLEDMNEKELNDVLSKFKFSIGAKNFASFNR